MRLAVLLGTGAINHLREMHDRSRTLLFRIANGYKEGKGEMFEIDAGNLLTSHIQGEKLVEGSFNMTIRGRNISRITEILREFGRQSGSGVRMEVLTADFDASPLAIRMATQEAKDNAFGKVDEQVYELAKRYEKDDILFRTELLDCQKRISEIQIDSQLKSKGEYFVGKSYDVHVKSLPVSVIEAHIKVKLSPRQI